jgi:hypothetical protein
MNKQDRQQIQRLKKNIAKHHEGNEGNERISITYQVINELVVMQGKDK